MTLTCIGTVVSVMKYNYVVVGEFLEDSLFSLISCNCTFRYTFGINCMWCLLFRQLLNIVISRTDRSAN